MNHLFLISFCLLGMNMAQANGPVMTVPGKVLLVPATNGSFDTWVPNSDMAAVLSPGSMELRGPIAAPTWHTRFSFTGIGRNGDITSPWSARRVERTDSSLLWTGGHIGMEYLLQEEGLRQNFHVAKREPGMGPLELSINLSSPLCVSVFGQDLLFHDVNGTFVHAYKGLTVWDDCGTPLNAWYDLNSSPERIRIVVDDMRAVYPITIDPVSTTASRQLNSMGVTRFGRCVSSAGDLNGDGYSDVVVGAPALNPDVNPTIPGAAYVYYGSATGIGAAPNVTLTSGVPGLADNFGLAVDGAGDVNGDGYEDLIVGASTWNDNAATPTEGGVFVYHGSATGISTTPTYILQNNTDVSFMGSSVAGLGDINGDGYSDIIAGGWLATYGPTTSEGAAWIFLGSATGLNPVFRHRLEQNFGSAQFGYAVGAAGDVNGDGFNDVVIGAHKIRIPTGAPAITGGIYIYHGSANALGAGLNPAPTRAFTTTGYSTRNGWSVSSAGDVNADGYSDVIISDYQDQVGAENAEGVALIYHGSATGLNTIPATIIEGGAANLFFGISAGAAGDVNGDGYADVLVGCLQWTNGQANEGAAFLYLGSSTGINSSAFFRYEPNVASARMGEWVSTAGDVNGDGFSDMIVGAPGLSGGRAFIYHGGTYNVSTTPAMTRSGEAANALLGTAVANAGDVNGDGYADAIVGAPGASSGQPGEGLAYLHYGGVSGLSPLPALTLQADVAGAAFGTSVASAGDVNGDGYADVVIGAPLSNGIGRAYIFHGSATGLDPTPALTLSGTSGSLFGTSVFKAGDHNYDGFSDVLVGAPGADRVYLYPGSASGLDPMSVILNSPAAPGGSFGSAVCTAGDVNGDGLSDIVIGAPDATLSFTQEGAVYVYLGDLFEFPTTPQFVRGGGGAGRHLGSSVAGIGDMNGDGFHEVAAGAPDHSGTLAGEGGIWVFRGTPAGTSAVGPSFVGGQANARMGASVAEAGDVNGDGYADMIVGGPGYDNGQTDEGRTWVYLGDPVGFTAANHITLEPNSAGEGFGTAVAGGGDVDGDGYSDIMAGAPNAAPTVTNEGTVRLFRGNNGLSYNRLTRQYQADLTSPLATNGSGSSPAYFGIGHRARSHIQRTTARLRWEVVHEGQPFSGSPITNSVAFTGSSAGYTDLGLAGVEIKELIPKNSVNLRFKWRVRVEYPVHKSIDGQRFSRWFYGYAPSVGDIGVLPITLLSFNGGAIADGNLLRWTTGSEQQSDYFLVERSADGLDFTPVGSLDAAGESATARDYEFLDAGAPGGLSYYRLRMVDRDASEEFSNVVAITRDSRGIVVYPVPVQDALFWGPTGTSVARVIVHDALGRVVVDAAADRDMLSGSSVEQLATGGYSLLLMDEHGELIARSRFLKR